MKIKKFFKKSVKFYAHLFFVVAVLFSNFVSLLPQNLQDSKFAQNFKVKEAQAAAVWQATGALIQGAAAVSPVWPTHLINDIGIMVVETGGESTVAIAPTGWTAVTGSPVTDVATTAGSKLYIFWKRAVSNAEAAVSTLDSGDHQVAQIFTFRGIIETGNPWDVVATGVKTTASLTATSPSVTTTVADTLVLLIVGRPNDLATADFGAFTNAGLGAITERADGGGIGGHGGGFVLVTGTRAATGAIGTSVSTKVVSTTDTYMTIALKPQPSTTTIGDGVNPGDVTIAPEGVATMADAFTFIASAGTDSVTAVTTTFAVGTAVGVGLLEITNDAGTTVYGSIANPTDVQAITLTTALPVGAASTQFKIRITPKTHSAMAVPPGASYAVTATITAWTGTNAKLGTDTASATVTIDNLSPGGTTGASATAGDALVGIAWTNPADADFSNLVILRNTVTITAVPTEGSVPLVGDLFGTSVVRFTGTDSPFSDTGLTNGTLYYYRIFAKDTNGNYTALASTQEVSATPVAPSGPIITSYSNTEIALNYSAACAGCGARLGSGGSLQTVIITGTGFGVDPGAANRSTASDNIKIGTHQIVNANVTAWSDTSITITTDTANDADSLWGTVYGGAAALTVTNITASAGLNFYLFPQVISVTTPLVSNAARELDSITLNGTRLGSGAGSMTILGIAGAPSAWNNTAITVPVPSAIANNLYSGNIVVTQGTGGNAKTHTYGSTFQILPNITSFTPTSGFVLDTITVNGDHLCQNTGTCPTVLDATHIVTFTSAVNGTAPATWSWTDSGISIVVPTGAVTGNVVVTSGSYTSNGSSFAVTVPSTTLATGTDPAAATIAPGAVATDVNLFTLQTNNGTESVTSVTVNLSTLNGVGRLAITNNAGTELGFTATPATGSNVITVTGMSAGTTATIFKVRITPLSHAGMPVVPGAGYAITAPVTAWGGVNTHAGSDTNPNALTIDNLSPAGTTGASATAGDTLVSVAWTNPADVDFSNVIILCKTSSVLSADAPVEGSAPGVDATACGATALVKYTGGTSPQLITGLTNGTLYYFRIFAKDTNGNYTAHASTQEVSATPVSTPVVTAGTSGTQTYNINSGSVYQFVGAAFTFQQNTGTADTITALTVSETGTVDGLGTLASSTIRYSTGQASCTYTGTETIAKAGVSFDATDKIVFTALSIPVTVGANFTCVYLITDYAKAGNYPTGGQTFEPQITAATDYTLSGGTTKAGTYPVVLAGSTTVKPVVISYTNSTDSALNYSGACAGCGARIGGGSGFRQSLTLSGYGFGAPSAGSRANATNNVKVGTHSIADANLTAWATTTITMLTDTATTGDADTDWGTNFGGTGASGLSIMAGATSTPSSLNFYVFPQVTSISTPLVANAAREYNASDTDGVVTLNGTRFGTASTGGSVTILSITAVTTSWGNTAIVAQVPPTIADNLYTGNVAMTQGTGSNNKTHSFTTSGFSILPRIATLVPSSASVGEAITVNGDHLCQTGACPGAFGATDKVTFTSEVDATVFTSWSHTAIATAVPTGSVTGNATITSNGFTSNVLVFTLTDPTPTTPTNAKQARDSAFTKLITTGDYASSTPIYFSLDTTSSVSGGTMYAQVEARPVLGGATAFTSVCAGNAYCFEGTGSAYTSGTITLSAASTTANDLYHWQARARYNKGGIDFFSPWQSYPVTSTNAETSIDFTLDTASSTITAGPSATVGTNTATITWSTGNEISTSRIEYDTAGTLVGGYDCSGTSECTALTDTSPMVLNHSVLLSNLSSGTTYTYRVRSKDAAGNETISSSSTFLTQSVTKPAKITRFHIVGKTGAVTNASPLSEVFTVAMPENATTTKSIFIEISGIYSATAVSPTLTVQVNSETSKVYVLPYNANPTVSHFKILHSVAGITVDPGTNTITVTPDVNTTAYVSSADMSVNYVYTP